MLIDFGGRLLDEVPPSLSREQLFPMRLFIVLKSGVRSIAGLVRLHHGDVAAVLLTFRALLRARPRVVIGPTNL